MKDIYEAVEQLSALLSFRIENLARAKGYATKPYSWIVAPADGKLVIVVATTLYLPEGLCASFTPRAEPQGDAWQIDVRRTDSVVREPWAEGLTVSKTVDGKKFVVSRNRNPLSDEALAGLIDELARP